ncbi:MAG TPA: NlpC/P60 family protein [Atopostipes sp.]|nr:NlpC/P60 family protein [Atopostipes sp.]
MFKKRLVRLAMAGTIGFTALASPGLLAQATPSNVSDYDTLIQELTSEQNEASNKLSNLQKEISENEKEAEKLVQEMEETKELLNALQTEIDELKVNIQQREDQLKEQARALQVMGESSNIVSFVLNADSLNDVIGRIDVVTTLVSSNQQTLAQQEKDKALVEEKEAETVKKQEEQTTLAAKLEENKTVLEEQKAEQESLLARIASEKAIATEERDALVARAEAAEQRRQELQTARTTSENAVNNSNSGAVTPASTSTSADSKAKPEPKAPAANSGSILDVAHSLSGVPYNYGGTTTAGFDCSGFTAYVFNQAGRSLPRTAAGQYSATSRVSRSQAQPGDLVFFNIGGGINHVGIYLGGGNFIGSQTSTGVAVASINSGFWANKVVGFGR